MRKSVLAIVLAFVASAVFAERTIRVPDFIWENADSNKYHVGNVKLGKLTPGERAIVSMWVDAKGLCKAGVPEASLAWDDSKGQWFGSSGGTKRRWKDKAIEKDAQGRRKFEIDTGVIPPDAASFKLQFFAKKPAIGRIVYSDIAMTVLDREYELRLRTSAYRNVIVNGKVRLLATFVTAPEIEPTDRLVGTFVFRSTDGRTVRRTADRVDSTSAEAVLSAADFAKGEQDVEFVLSLRNGGGLVSKKLPVRRVDELPKRRVSFDRFGRTLVGGKPFFPLGMYWSENTLSMSNALERYAAPGVFNCLQNYEKRMTREMLDGYFARGLMVMASVKDIYIPDPDGSKVAFCPADIRTKDEETAYVTALVNDIKGHPALLAWYTCDELAKRWEPRLRDRYELLKRMDPDHPVYVLAFTNATGAFLEAYDVTGTDPYPICDPWSARPSHDCLRPGEGAVWRAGDAARDIVRAMKGIVPMWQVPQAFKWQWDHKKKWEERFPTRRELSSMTWQQIAEGANGIFFYSYGQMRNNCISESELTEYFDEISVPVAREVKEVMPILLLEPGPKAADVPERIRVRTWKADAKTYVLVCNTHPERRTGRVVIPGTHSSVKTVFGKGGVTLRDGALELDLGPIESTMVGLE